MPDNCEMSRREFLASLAGAAGVVLVVGGCQGNETPAGTTPPGAAEIAATKNADGSYTVPGAGKVAAGNAIAFSIPLEPEKEPGIVFVTAQNELKALSAKCTHNGCTVKWAASTGNLKCPCHDSVFDRTGKPLSGPAKKPLTAYEATRQGDDVVIKVKV